MGRRAYRTAGLLAVLAALLTMTGPQPPSARQWRTTPQALATDYAHIIDQRSQREVVALIWLTPMVLPNDAASQLGRELLSQYLMLGIVHADVNLDGTFSFRKVPRLDIEANKSERRSAMDDTTLPPAIAGGLKAVQATFQQLLGPLGRGTQWFVFDGRDLPSCGQGGFVVPYDGVLYNYELPIPGCSRKV